MDTVAAEVDLIAELGIHHPGYSFSPESRAKMSVPISDSMRKVRPGSSEIFRFGRDKEYVLRMATREEDRLRCWHLVYKEYLAQGYAEHGDLEYRYSLHDALPDTGTFFVEVRGEAVGTVSVFPDSPLGLPADDIYKAEVDSLRKAGRRPVEVGRLTICREYMNDRAVLAGLFDAMALYARQVLRSTDLIITVNPSHAKFYERMLQFDLIGEQKDMGSVCGAPAVLLRLDRNVETACRKWAHREGPKPGRVTGHRTFYSHLSSVSEGRGLRQKLAERREVPDEEFLKRYFVWLSPLLSTLSAPLKYFFEKCYPQYDLAETFVMKSELEKHPAWENRSQ